MSKYNTPINVCDGLTVFIIEIRNQIAALRAYYNVFQNAPCNNIFLQQALDSIWRDLLSEIANIFDSASTGTNENCTLLRLKELCYKEQYLSLFPNKEENEILQELDNTLEYYNQLPIKKSRRKQLAHHDLKQVIAGECIEISLEEIEDLVKKLTYVFEKIRTTFSLGYFEFSFRRHDFLVEQFENDIKKLIG